jgi:hypothetical protein
MKYWRSVKEIRVLFFPACRHSGNEMTHYCGRFRQDFSDRIEIKSRRCHVRFWHLTDIGLCAAHAR